MADLPLELGDMLMQWRALPAGDRKAILKRLPLEQRIMLDRTLARRDERDTQPADHSPTQEFARYSPWLADLVAACVEDSGQASNLTPATCAAIRAAHAEIAAHPPETAPLSLGEVIQRRLRDWGVWP